MVQFCAVRQRLIFALKDFRRLIDNCLLRARTEINFMRSMKLLFQNTIMKAPRCKNLKNHLFFDRFIQYGYILNWGVDRFLATPCTCQYCLSDHLSEQKTHRLEYQDVELHSRYLNSIFLRIFGFREFLSANYS